MSVRIRLRRMGKKKSPSYRLAVVDSRVKRDGRFVEFVGYYNPMTQPPKMKLEEEKIIGWLKNGATLSDTVGSILRDAGILARWHEMRTGQKVEKGAAAPAAAAPKPEKSAAKGKAKKEEAAPAVAEAPAAEALVAEAPAPEAPAAPQE